MIYNRKEKSKNIFLSIISILLILGIWYIVSWISYYFRGVDFPNPMTTFGSLLKKLSGESIYDHSIYQHTLGSLYRWFFAYFFAVFIGIGTGILLGLSSTASKILMPLIHLLQLIPGLAWIPIVLLLFGMGNISTLFMIFILAVTPIVITTSTGIRETSPDLINKALIMGASKKMLIIHVLLPASLFHIINGMRMGLANSWRVLIAAEMIVGNGVGLGYIIIQSRWSLDYVSAFVSLIVIVGIGLTSEKLIFKKIEDAMSKKYGHSKQSDFLTAE